MPRFPDEPGVNGHAAMLNDIAEEVAATRWETGRDEIDSRVLEAMAGVPRDVFVPSAARYLAFHNGPVSIGHGQTISQPFIVALMTDLLDIRPEQTILEVGTGSGYQAAVLARLARQVYSVEIIAALARTAGERLQQLGRANVEVRHGDGYEGWPEHAPYDGIIVTAAASHVPPPLVSQLKAGGRLVIPVGFTNAFQTLRVIEKGGDGEISTRNILTVAFVPLTRDLREA